MKRIQRTFIPGDKWVYFKIYTGIRTADLIIKSKLYQVIKRMILNGSIQKFYFIRYYDPDFHIRLRFLTYDNVLVGDVVDVIYNVLKPMLNKQWIWKIQLDTYQRELERYNPYLIENAESIFYVDSVCVIQIIRQLEKNLDEKYRWMISLSLIDEFLSDFNFNITMKRDFMTFLSDVFKVEFGFDKFNSKQFNQKYKVDKSTVESILSNSDVDENFNKLKKWVSKRSTDMQPLIRNMRYMMKKKRLNVEDYLGSYIHMTLNRLFRADNRLYELIIYDYMRRYYTSQVVRNNSIDVLNRG